MAKVYRITDSEKKRRGRKKPVNAQVHINIHKLTKTNKYTVYIHKTHRICRMKTPNPYEQIHGTA